MSEFTGFVHLGFRHIVSLDALDHILFLLALAAIYQGRDWKGSLWVISAFTVGHSITLAMAATGTLLIPQRLTEFLIPLTIVATGLHNIVTRGRGVGIASRYRPLFAGVFGLVHGAGFGGYLQQLFLGSVVGPLRACSSTSTSGIDKMHETNRCPVSRKSANLTHHVGSHAGRRPMRQVVCQPQVARHVFRFRAPGFRDSKASSPYAAQAAGRSVGSLQSTTVVHGRLYDRLRAPQAATRQRAGITALDGRRGAEKTQPRRHARQRRPGSSAELYGKASI